MSEPEIAWHLSFWCWGCKRKSMRGKHPVRNPRTKRMVSLCDECNDENTKTQAEWRRVYKSMKADGLVRKDNDKEDQTDG